MVCHHCHADNQDSASACSACGKPLSPRTRSRRSRKEGRRRGEKTAATQVDQCIDEKPSSADNLASAAATPSDAARMVPALVSGHPAAGCEEKTPTSLVLAPSYLPAPIAPAQSSTTATGMPPSKKRQGKPVMQALSICCVMAAALWFAFNGEGHGGTPQSGTTAASTVHLNPPVVAVSVDSVVKAEPLAAAIPRPLQPPRKAAPAERTVAKLAPSNSEIRKKSATPATAHSSGKQLALHEKKKRVENPAPAPMKLEQVTPRQTTDGTLLASKQPSEPNMYAQCQELSSFLSRERCKWQACSGKWGQDGCPSYSNGNQVLN